MPSRFAAKKGVDAMSGARNLRRVIAKEIEDPLSDLLLAGPVQNSRIMIRAEGDEFCVFVCEESLLPA